MKTFQQFMTEGVSAKVDTLLRVDAAASAHPDYTPISRYLGAPAPAHICMLARTTLDAVNAGRLPTSKSVVALPLHYLVPTQQTVHTPNLVRVAFSTAPILVMRTAHGYYILDGHHRAVDAVLQKQRSITARLVYINRQ